jgi:hypothetical protein
MRIASSLVAAVVFLALCLPGQLFASDVAGNWKWQISPQGGDPIDMSATFKADDGKLRGVFLDGFDQQKFDIKDGKVDGDNISFTVTRPINDQTITVNYSGKLDGDTIKGTMEIKFADQEPMKNDWKADRVKDAATQPATQP